MAEIVTLPGYYTETSDRGARNRWKHGNNVRFIEEMPEKIGGSQPQVGSTFLGKARKLHPFKSLSGKRYIALGTHLKLYVYDGGSQNDITPVRATGTLSDPFSTSATSATVTVADVAHGLSVNDFVFFSDATASPTDGIIIAGYYQVITVPTVDSYTITHSVVAATSEASFGGASVAYSYQIPVGEESSGIGDGWGGSTWGTGTWGTPRTGSSITTNARTWSIDNWGEDLVASPRGSKIYFLDTSAGTVANPATVISQAPATNEYIIVSPENRFLISLGAHDGSNSDPMLVRWCSQENYTIWTPTPTNTAGDKRLDKGTKLVTGAFGRKTILILSDSAAYAMVAAEFPDIFNIDLIGDKCGASSPGCLVFAPNNSFYWMGDGNFFSYDGIQRVMSCDVHSYVFGNINLAQKDKIFSGVMSDKNEVWWGYCSASSNEIDRYVIYNYELKCWYYGEWTTARTALIDKSDSFSAPLAAGTDGMLHGHEIGVDDGSTPIVTLLERYDAEVEEGDETLFISKFIPDFSRITGTVNVTFVGKPYPQSSETVTKGPYMVTPTTPYVSARMRAGQASVKIECSALGDDWRLGTLRVDAVPVGMRT